MDHQLTAESVEKLHLVYALAFLNKFQTNFRLQKFRLQDVYHSLIQCEEATVLLDVIARIFRVVLQQDSAMKEYSGLVTIRTVERCLAVFLWQQNTKYRRILRAQLNIPQDAVKLSELECLSNCSNERSDVPFIKNLKIGEDRATFLKTFIDFVRDEFSLSVIQSASDLESANMHLEITPNRFLHFFDDGRLYEEVFEKPGLSSTWKMLAGPSVQEWRAVLPTLNLGTADVATDLTLLLEYINSPGVLANLLELNPNLSISAVLNQELRDLAGSGGNASLASSSTAFQTPNQLPCSNTSSGIPSAPYPGTSSNVEGVPQGSDPRQPHSVPLDSSGMYPGSNQPLLMDHPKSVGHASTGAYTDPAGNSSYAFHSHHSMENVAIGSMNPGSCHNNNNNHSSLTSPQHVPQPSPAGLSATSCHPVLMAATSTEHANLGDNSRTGSVSSVIDSVLAAGHAQHQHVQQQIQRNNSQSATDAAAAANSLPQFASPLPGGPGSSGPIFQSTLSDTNNTHSHPQMPPPMSTAVPEPFSVSNMGTPRTLTNFDEDPQSGFYGQGMGVSPASSMLNKDKFVTNAAPSSAPPPMYNSTETLPGMMMGGSTGTTTYNQMPHLATFGGTPGMEPESMPYNNYTAHQQQQQHPMNSGNYKLPESNQGGAVPMVPAHSQGAIPGMPPHHPTVGVPTPGEIMPNMTPEDLARIQNRQKKLEQIGMIESSLYRGNPPGGGSALPTSNSGPLVNGMPPTPPTAMVGNPMMNGAPGMYLPQAGNPGVSMSPYHASNAYLGHAPVGSDPVAVQKWHQMVQEHYHRKMAAAQKRGGPPLPGGGGPGGMVGNTLSPYENLMHHQQQMSMMAARHRMHPGSAPMGYPPFMHPSNPYHPAYGNGMAMRPGGMFPPGGYPSHMVYGPGSTPGVPMPGPPMNTPPNLNSANGPAALPSSVSSSSPSTTSSQPAAPTTTTSKKRKKPSSSSNNTTASVEPPNSTSSSTVEVATKQPRECGSEAVHPAWSSSKDMEESNANFPANPPSMDNSGRRFPGSIDSQSSKSNYPPNAPLPPQNKSFSQNPATITSSSSSSSYFNPSSCSPAVTTSSSTASTSSHNNILNNNVTSQSLANLAKLSQSMTDKSSPPFSSVHRENSHNNNTNPTMAPSQSAGCMMENGSGGNVPGQHGMHPMVNGGVDMGPMMSGVPGMMDPMMIPPQHPNAMQSMQRSMPYPHHARSAPEMMMLGPNGMHYPPNAPGMLPTSGYPNPNGYPPGNTVMTPNMMKSAPSPSSCYPPATMMSMNAASGGVPGASMSTHRIPPGSASHLPGAPSHHNMPSAGQNTTAAPAIMVNNTYYNTQIHVAKDSFNQVGCQNSQMQLQSQSNQTCMSNGSMYMNQQQIQQQQQQQSQHPQQPVPPPQVPPTGAPSLPQNHPRMSNMPNMPMCTQIPNSGIETVPTGNANVHIQRNAPHTIQYKPKAPPQQQMSHNPTQVQQQQPGPEDMPQVQSHMHNPGSASQPQYPAMFTPDNYQMMKQQQQQSHQQRMIMQGPPHGGGGGMVPGTPHPQYDMMGAPYGGPGGHLHPSQMLPSCPPTGQQTSMMHGMGGHTQFPAHHGQQWPPTHPQSLSTPVNYPI